MRPLKISLTLILVGLMLWLTLPARSSAPSDRSMPPQVLMKLHPALAKQLLSEPNAPVRVQIVMREQVALAAADRAGLVAHLQARAERSQAGVRALLTTLHASDVRPLWINNSIAARLDRVGVLAVAERADVALIKLDQLRQWVAPLKVQSPIDDFQSPASIEWGLIQIHADQVWSALGITGTGVVVANMDTGVDWQHPALRANYRGLSPKGLVNHTGNWIDTTNEATIYPFDGFGHGTHTLGTLAGQGGIGVAPGARWIAVRVLNSQGYGLDSWIHAGFQWILAPNGQADLAPDILNNSWGNNLGGVEEFRPDVQLLNAAGIFTVFSNGNAGPGGGTVGSPASFPESFSVGATDHYDQLALFSSRGPSPFDVIKPDVSAPGVGVLSSIPGGVYVRADGTSMAAPHVAGTAALMYSARPDLTIAAARFALTSTTTRPTTDTYPNNLYGWGRIDAFRAVLAVAQTGFLSGTITRQDNAAPIEWATVAAQSDVNALAITTTNVHGHYQLPLSAAHYTVTVAAFGYQPQAQANIVVLTDTVTRRDYVLTPLPQGQLKGRLLNVTGTQLVSGTLFIGGAPLSQVVSGSFSLDLPVGVHTLEVRAPRHRIVSATVTIKANETLDQDFVLPDAPTILLIDGGRWYNDPAGLYFRQALADARYQYDTWPVIDPLVNRPVTRTLRTYDTVIWSAPLDSPGYIGADGVISDFLDTGGHLLLSGQDVAYFDGWWTPSLYFDQQLLAGYVADDAPARALTGQNHYAGQTITIAGGDGADDQALPDVIRSLAPQITQNAFEYASDSLGAPGILGAQTIDRCRPYRAAYLAFGFQGINDRQARADVLTRTLAALDRPPLQQVYAFDADTTPLVGPPGTIVTRALTLYNFDEVAAHTPMTLTVDSAWPITFTPTSVDFASCAQQTMIVTAAIPLTAPTGALNPIVIHARPPSALAAISTTLTVKAPGAVLLVEDDRWYSMEAAYRAGLEASAVPYDVWRVPTNWSGFEPSAPDIDRLRWYPSAIWFTGYDWYQTLTAKNEQTLRQFAAEGGRFALSSQDYLSERGFNAFGREVLGVLAFSEDVVARQASGPHGSRFAGLNRAALSWPYRNYSDALAPQPGASVELIGQHGWPIALSNAYGAGRALFMAFGWEGFAPEQQSTAMHGVISALSWLGSSTVQFDREVAVLGEPLTLTIRAVNDGPRVIDQAALTATLPISLAGLGDPLVVWQGALQPGEVVTQVLTVTPTASGAISLPVVFHDLDHQLAFTSLAQVAVDVPVIEVQLSPSASPVTPHQVVTWTLTAHNRGADWPTGVITGLLPFEQFAIDDTVTATLGTATHLSGTVTWRGALLADQSITVTYQLTTPFDVENQVLYGSAAVIADAGVWHTGAWLTLLPRRAYLPIVRK